MRRKDKDVEAASRGIKGQVEEMLCSSQIEK